MFFIASVTNVWDINTFRFRLNPMFHFYTLWKRKNSKGFLSFSGCVEVKYWAKMKKYISKIIEILKFKGILYFSYKTDVTAKTQPIK